MCDYKLYMSRILAFDVGKKRIGVAVTDPLQMIANGLQTVPAHEIWDFIKAYVANEEVSQIVVGYPRQMNNEGSEALHYVNPFVKRLRKLFPDLPVALIDERFTSKMAHQTMLDGGLKKKARQNKALVDTISATIILQSYLQQRSNTI